MAVASHETDSNKWQVTSGEQAAIEVASADFSSGLDALRNWPEGRAKVPPFQTRGEKFGLSPPRQAQGFNLPRLHVELNGGSFPHLSHADIFQQGGFRDAELAREF